MRLNLQEVGGEKKACGEGKEGEERLLDGFGECLVVLSFGWIVFFSRFLEYGV